MTWPCASIKPGSSVLPFMSTRQSSCVGPLVAASGSSCVHLAVAPISIAGEADDLALVVERHAVDVVDQRVGEARRVASRASAASRDQSLRIDRTR